MDLSKINEIISSPRENKLFLALKIESDKIKSALWTIEENEAKIASLGTNEEWGGTREELVAACDTSIASAVTKLPETTGQEPNQVILGLPYSWIKDGKILRERLEDLKFLTEKLTLQALGYTVNSEAVCFNLKNQKKDFSSAILVYLGASEITLALVKESRTIQIETVGRSDNLALDVEEGVLRFSSVSNLPTQIFLYDGEDLEMAKQTLISYPWQPPSDSEKEKRPGFLHLPRVEILPINFDIEAVAFSGAKEISKGKAILSDENLSETREEPSNEVVFKKEEVASEEIIFVKDKDILEEAVSTEGSKELVESEEDIVQEKYSVDSAPQSTASFSKPEKPASLSKKVKHSFSFLKSFPRNLFKAVSNFGHSLFSFRFPLKNWLFFVPLGIVFLVLISFYLLAKAQIILTVADSRISREFEFTVDTNQEEIDFSQKIIPGRLESVMVSGSKAGVVTGKKIVGDKAKGEVTLYNRTDSTKTYSPGTFLVGPGKLKFVLDQEIRIASKSPDLGSGVDRWGEAKAQVSAAEIGAQYNVAPESQFIIEGYSSSSFLAKNAIAFAGGTSRQISVVSKDDREKLFADLTEELKKKAEEEIKKGIPPEEILLPETLVLAPETETFDHELQDESSALSLDLAVKATATSVEKESLLNLAMDTLSFEISGKPTMQVDKIKSEVLVTKVIKSQTGGESLLLGKAEIVLRQTIDDQKIIKKFVGRSTKFAEKTILDLEGIKHVEIKFTPGIFSFFSRLPLKRQNISLQIITENDGQI